jgi:hypothetical protein
VSGQEGKNAMSGNMRGKLAFVVLATTTALGVVGTTSAAWSFFDGRHHRGGFVKPCSLDGVNPAYHPDIFGNPALARAYYGFLQGPNHTWYVEPNCHIYN